MSGLFLLALIVLQRLAELALARRNARALLRRGAVEHGAAHYPAMVALHLAWLVALGFVAQGANVAWPWIAAYLVLQALRVWTIHTLGPRWTTRIYILPDAPPVTTGPFRYLAHPNYAVVTLELALVPLAMGAEALALAFSVLNAAMLWVRVRTEDRALGRATDRPVPARHR